MSVGRVSVAVRVRVVSPPRPPTIPFGLLTSPLKLTTRTGFRLGEDGASTYCCQPGAVGQSGSAGPAAVEAPAEAGVTSRITAAADMPPASAARRRRLRRLVDASRSLGMAHESPHWAHEHPECRRSQMRGQWMWPVS